MVSVWHAIFSSETTETLATRKNPQLGDLFSAGAAAAKEAASLGIPVIALFPSTDPKLKTDDGREAFNTAAKQRRGLLGVTDLQCQS